MSILIATVQYIQMRFQSKTREHSLQRSLRSSNAFHAIKTQSHKLFNQHLPSESLYIIYKDLLSNPFISPRKIIFSPEGELQPTKNTGEKPEELCQVLPPWGRVLFLAWFLQKHTQKQRPIQWSNSSRSLGCGCCKDRSTPYPSTNQRCKSRCLAVSATGEETRRGSRWAELRSTSHRAVRGCSSKNTSDLEEKNI